MGKPEFKHIRPALAKHDFEGLLALVIDLYKLNSTNRDYLHARFDSSELVIRKFKKKVSDLIYPETYCETDKIPFGEARRQINAFKKRPAIARRSSRECGQANFAKVNSVGSPKNALRSRIGDRCNSHCKSRRQCPR